MKCYLIILTGTILSSQLFSQEDSSQFGYPVQSGQTSLPSSGQGEDINVPLQLTPNAASPQAQGYGLPMPSSSQIQQEIQQINSQISSLEAKRDSIKQNLGYFTNETTGFQESNGLSYSQNRDRETYYQAQLDDLENQIASLKNKRDQLSMIAD